MAKRRERLCSFPGCKHLTLSRFCDQHMRTRRLYQSDYDRESKRFLNSVAWRNLSALKLSETPWCEECALTNPLSVPATQVDHIKPRRTHPELALEPSNLQSLCDECHGRKTRRGE